MRLHTHALAIGTAYKGAYALTELRSLMPGSGAGAHLFRAGRLSPDDKCERAAIDADLARGPKICFHPGAAHDNGDAWLRAVLVHDSNRPRNTLIRHGIHHRQAARACRDDPAR